MNKLESKNLLVIINNLLKKMNDDNFSEWNNKTNNAIIKTVLIENAANPFDTEIQKISFNNFINS